MRTFTTVLITLALMLAAPFGLAVPSAHAQQAGSATATAAVLTPEFQKSFETFSDRLDEALIDYYMAPDAPVDIAAIAPPAAVLAELDPALGQAIAERLATDKDLASAVGFTRATLQQAFTLNMANAVLRGDLDAARAWRVQILLPRGVSAVDGALLLQTLGARPGNRKDAARILTREAITWQTTRVRQLLSQIEHAASQSVPMPGRLRQRLAEATTLATLPPSLVAAAQIKDMHGLQEHELASLRTAVITAEWSDVRSAFVPLGHLIESGLPSLLSAKEQNRVERLLLKLAALTPREYAAGVRDGQVVVALEYREAIAFTAQCKQLVAQLAPIWLSSDKPAVARKALDELELHLNQAQAQIEAKADSKEVDKTFAAARKVMEDDLGISLALRGTTSDIVEVVMLETRSLLKQSLSAAIAGQWAQAERLRLEAYTTYDPELEARLMPRDPQLAIDIEMLLLDGLDKPGVKALLDKRASQPELEEAYTRVNDALQQAAVMLKTSVSPAAAIFNALSIVLREGLEGLLVLIAIFAGLKGAQNAQRRKLMWMGIAAAMVATALTWIASQTLITSLRAYGEVIAAVTGIIAIFILLLITNWLFHQIYWKQWISTLKIQAVEGESPWQLFSVGFAIGYREGFETVLFLQNLALDAGGSNVAIGVVIGVVILIVLGYFGLQLGWRLPYFKLLLVTAALVGVVLITFTGNTVRALQTVGWLDVHRLFEGSWPQWLGTWFGMYNTWESMLGQMLAVTIVLGTWRLARMQAKRKALKRRKEMAAQKASLEDQTTMNDDPAVA